MKTTRPALATLIVAALLGASACSSDDGPTADDETRSVSATDSATSSTGDGESSDSPSGSAEAPTSDEDLKPLMDAIATAEKSLGGTAYEADNQDSDGTWEINIAVKDKSIEAKVSSDGSKVVRQDDEETLDDDERAGLEAAEVTIGDAIDTAMKETNGTFDDAEIEQKNGTHVWEVSVDTADGDVDVLVDVTSGKVIGISTD